MPLYDLHATCPHCGGLHDVLVRIALDDSFDVRSISDQYRGGNVPPEFYTVASQRIICAKTAKSFTQPDPSKLILVAVPHHDESTA